MGIGRSNRMAWFHPQRNRASFAWLLLAGLQPAAARANVTAEQQVSAEGSVLEPWAAGGDVRIVRELIRLRQPVFSTAQWDVAYDLAEEGGKDATLDVAFPVEVLTAGTWGCDSAADTEMDSIWALAPVLADEPRFADLAREIAAVEEPHPCDDELAGRWEDALLAAPLDIRRSVAPGSLTSFGIERFAVQQDGRLVDLSSVEVHVTHVGSADLLGPVDRNVGAHGWGPGAGTPTPRGWIFSQTTPQEPADARRLLITLKVKFRLQFRAESTTRVLVHYWAETPAYTGFKGGIFATSYLLGPGRTWKGPIGDLTLLVHRCALRGLIPPVLPFAAVPFRAGEYVGWRVRDYEPALGDRVLLGGHAFDAAGEDAGGESDCWAIGSSVDDAELGWGFPGSQPTVAVAAPSSTSVRLGKNLFPAGGDGVALYDLGFGPGNAFDGDPRTAWCSAGAARLLFTLPEPVEGTTVLLGDHKGYSFGPCPPGTSPPGRQPSGAIPVEDTEGIEDVPPQGLCALPDPPGITPSGLPASVTLGASRGDRLTLDPVDGSPHLLRAVDPALGPGTYGLDLHGAGGCIAEVGLPTQLDPWLAKALADLDRFVDDLLAP